MTAQPYRPTAPTTGSPSFTSCPPPSADQLISCSLRPPLRRRRLARATPFPPGGRERETAEIFCGATEDELWQSVAAHAIITCARSTCPVWLEHMTDAERLSKLRHDLSNPLSALLAETQLLLLNESQIDPDDGHRPPGDRGAGDPDADDAARALTPLEQIGGQKAQAGRARRRAGPAARTLPADTNPSIIPATSSSSAARADHPDRQPAAQHQRIAPG